MEPFQLLLGLDYLLRDVTVCSDRQPMLLL